MNDDELVSTARDVCIHSCAGQVDRWGFPRLELAGQVETFLADQPGVVRAAGWLYAPLGTDPILASELLDPTTTHADLIVPALSASLLGVAAENIENERLWTAVAADSIAAKVGLAHVSALAYPSRAALLEKEERYALVSGCVKIAVLLSH